MGEARKAEAAGVRRWDRDVAAANDLDEVRDFVVWGVGDAGALGLEDADDGGDLAWMIAEERDPEWADDAEHERWVLIVHADEDDVDGLALDQDAVRGYAAYLVERELAEADTRPMTGNLRGDRITRRPFDTGRVDRT